mgnify:CR=1 FL=1
MVLSHLVPLASCDSPMTEPEHCILTPRKKTLMTHIISNFEQLLYRTECHLAQEVLHEWSALYFITTWILL